MGRPRPRRTHTRPCAATPLESHLCGSVLERKHQRPMHFMYKRDIPYYIAPTDAFSAGSAPLRLGPRWPTSPTAPPYAGRCASEPPPAPPARAAGGRQCFWGSTCGSSGSQASEAPEPPRLTHLTWLMLTASENTAVNSPTFSSVPCRPAFSNGRDSCTARAGRGTRGGQPRPSGSAGIGVGGGEGGGARGLAGGREGCALCGPWRS